jgi:maleylpyruvate isomerase
VAIIEYLEERWPTPPLLPAAPLARARIREVVEIVNSGIQPLQNTKTLAALREAGGAEAEARFRHDAIARGLTALERAAAASQGGRFFSGDAPTLADLFIVPQLYNARRFDVSLAACPRLCAIEAHALEHPAFQAADPARQPDAPRPDVPAREQDVEARGPAREQNKE